MFPSPRGIGPSASSHDLRGRRPVILICPTPGTANPHPFSTNRLPRSTITPFFDRGSCEAATSGGSNLDRRAGHAVAPAKTRRAGSLYVGNPSGALVAPTTPAPNGTLSVIAHTVISAPARPRFPTLIACLLEWFVCDGRRCFLDCQGDRNARRSTTRVPVPPRRRHVTRDTRSVGRLKSRSRRECVDLSGAGMSQHVGYR
jgi:hypothetical protein